MSDEQLRELERRWRASGSDDDEAAFLAEQVRQGQLRASRLNLAAVLGHPAAIRATSRPAAPLDDTFRGALRDAIRGDEEAMARACVSMALYLLWTMPGEAEHNPVYASSLAMAIRHLNQECLNISAGKFDTRSAARAVEAFLYVGRVQPTADDRRSLPLEEIVFAAARFRVEVTEDSHANTYRAIALGLIPWLLGRGDQILDWFQRTSTSM